MTHSLKILKILKRSNFLSKMFSPLKLDVEDFCDIVFILAHFVLLQPYLVTQ